MKYSKEFNRDFNWYFTVRNIFNFAGREMPEMIFDRNGIDAKAAFWFFDSQGKILPTKHPNIFKKLLATKASVNLHIKMYAEDRAQCNWGAIEFRAFCIKIKAPAWFRQAVERQKFKYINPIAE